MRDARVALIGLACAAVVSGCSRGGSTAATSVSPPSPSSAHTAAAVTVPAGFPVGSYATIRNRHVSTLDLSGAATARFIYNTGVTVERTLEHLTFPATGQVVFDAGEGYLCQSTGTYRYTLTGSVLRFTAVDDKQCPDRVDILVHSRWRRA